MNGILAGATEFLHCYKNVPRKRDCSIVSSLREETGALKEESPCPEDYLAPNPQLKCYRIILRLLWIIKVKIMQISVYREKLGHIPYRISAMDFVASQ